MRALVLLGAMFGAAYTSCWWLAIGRMSTHGSPWNVLLIPLIVGGFATVVLFALVMVDAINKGDTP